MLVCLLGASPGLAASSSGGSHLKLDQKLNARAQSGTGKSRVILILKAGEDVSSQVNALGGRIGRRLGLLNGLVVELPNQALTRVADHPGVISMHWDRPVSQSLNQASVTIGARAVKQTLGYDGSGIGVAVIDSGITAWHDDLTYTGASTLVKTEGSQRVAKFVDFVNGRESTYDDNGHGTHVSGIIAGNGYDSRGAHAGVAPGAHLVGLKVLDSMGRGVISSVIAALEWTVVNGAAYNIRVVNLSVGAAVTQSYNTDPLTLAAKIAVDAGLVVVTAAGNLGRNSEGSPQYGGILAPGNAPWVLTVGAYSHQGTIRRTDDIMAPYSSRGPTAIDYAAKPDLVAPGTGIVSLSDPASTLYVTKAAYLLDGTVALDYKPYLSLSGTSMSAPLVSGSVALMLQANPHLTPNLVKAILQYTAQVYTGYDALTQGAGFVNTKGAVDLARFFASAQPAQAYPRANAWSRAIHWGNRRISGGVLKPNANAWGSGVLWGSAFDAEGDHTVWGTRCGETCTTLVWGTREEEDNVTWSTASGDEDNLVWGTYTDEGDNIVWGTVLLEQADNIVWGTDCGGDDCQGVVWGTLTGLVGEFDNIVWGTLLLTFDVLWITGELDNIVWGTSGEGETATWFDADAEVVSYEDVNFEDIFADPPLLEPVEETLETETITTTETTDDSLLGGGGF